MGSIGEVPLREHESHKFMTGGLRAFPLSHCWVVLAMCALTKQAQADDNVVEPPPVTSGAQLSLRVGYAVPFGKVQVGTDLSSLASPQGSFDVDFGWRFGSHVFVGAYAGVGVGAGEKRFERDCVSLDCSPMLTGRYGAEMIYYLSPSSLVNPWVGYGVGYESLSLSGSANDTTEHLVSASGLALARLLVGVDFRTNEFIGVGPFLDVSLARFDHVAVKFDMSSRTDPHGKATHGWLTVGVRLALWP